MDIWEKIKTIIESGVDLTIEYDKNQPGKGKFVTIDYRWNLIKQAVREAQNLDDSFYRELISLISTYLANIDDHKYRKATTHLLVNGEAVTKDYTLVGDTKFNIINNAEQGFYNNLFSFICFILESNPNIKLDLPTLKCLLDCKPKPSTVVWIRFRPFDYSLLAKTLRANQTLEKSGISLEETYQLLSETKQMTNDDVLVNLLRPENYTANHLPIDEYLATCGVIEFLNLSKIILNNYDPHLDRAALIKKRNENNFCEEVIMELLRWGKNPEDTLLIHQLLNDESISIDYGYQTRNHSESISLLDMLAFSENIFLIRDLLSHPQNIRYCYRLGERRTFIYNLYALVGDYERALAEFQKSYNYADDYFEDFDNDFKIFGATYVNGSYQDQLIAFLTHLCESFDLEGIEYAKEKEIITCILDSPNIAYINLSKLMTVISPVLTEEDLKSLLDNLFQRYKSGNLAFIESLDEQCRDHYLIRILKEQEIQTIISKKKDSTPNLVPTIQTDSN